MSPCSVSSTAAEQAASAVSIASTRMGSHAAKRPAEFAGAGSHRPDFGDIRYEMPQQILDAVPERRRRRRAARARPFHVEIDDAVLEAPEGDIAAVIGHCRPHPRLDQLLDGGDG